VTVFPLMDEWIAATGRSDAWLDLGLELMDGWQGAEQRPSGQAHLAAVLAALRTLRPVPPSPPDPVALAVWFHHGLGEHGSGSGGLESGAVAAYEALCELGEPAVAAEVARLVRLLGHARLDPSDVDGALFCAAHRAAAASRPASHLAPVPPVDEDQ
jgi:predicted metal-dependent HD superfamily phosphohydrolase